MRYLGNISPEWIEQLYLLWQSSPDAVSHDWQAFFSGLDLATESETSALSAEGDTPLKQSAVQSLIYRYRDIGHLLACTDPLSPCKIDHPLLTLDAFDLDTADLDRTFTCKRFYRERAPLREIINVLRDTYCRSIGVEFMHIQEPAERQWLIDRMEPVRNRPDLSEKEKVAILGRLREATRFEEYIGRRFMGQTRFSLEGGEVLVPLLDETFSLGARLGIVEVVMGMPHRGRLNVLANCLAVPLEDIFAQFRDNLEHGVVGDGDVKYHIGCSVDLEQADGRSIHVTLAANPSHLEAIDPVVEGKARARQELRGPEGKKEVLPLLIHGDAAFSGQGVVAETFNLSQLEGYGTGGTLHIVVNNQIGFTTLAKDARSSCYATDVAKMVMAPVFHVHGEDPEAAIHALRLALDYRQTYQRDVVV
ncbi:MAG TPA: thiamine pyrophosphate-dependent enzyme, partial [Geobacteraceae bacterium]